MNRNGRARGLALAAVLGAGLVACGRPGGEGAAPAPAGGGVARTAAEAGYLSPPRVLAVHVNGAEVVLTGRAAPNARIRADTLDKAAYGVTADDGGGFVLELPASTSPRLVAVSVESSRNSTPAQGWLFIPPDNPERAVLLRPGAGARPYPGAGLLATVDYDAAGGVAVSGAAAKNTLVEVSVDGGEAVPARADGEGRWSARLPASLSPGGHLLRARTNGVQVERQVALSPPRPSKGFEAARERDDWRVDWTPPGPGGGSQTTLVLLGART